MAAVNGVSKEKNPPLPEAPSELDKLRAKIDGGLKNLTGLVGAAWRPLPTGTGDGSYLQPEDPPAVISKVESFLEDLPHLGIKDISTLLKVQAQKRSGELTDDKSYLMEGLIGTAAALPDTSKAGSKITNEFLTTLWNDLEHPPQSYLGKHYQYREADGSYNSLLFPHVGAAKQPYARTCKPSTIQPAALPDPGTIFDAVMARNGEEKHPNRISSVLFYLASIIIHDLFRTDHEDYTRSLTSSYLDLAPLYGSDAKEQKLVRTFKDGKLKPDCFSEARLLSFPPGVGVLLIMFNRFHNYIVEQLALINEGGRFDKPVEGDRRPNPKTWDDYDNDLFQTGRLITCGLYINIILIDYVRTILNLNRTDSNWQLDPRKVFKDGPPLGVGNQVSAEFNSVYRWHSVVSTRDAKWTEDFFKRIYPGKDPETIELRDFMQGLKQLTDKTEEDPMKRDFAGLKRGPDGAYNDDELFKIMVESIEDCAGAYGANRVPKVMRAIEILGIEQARTWSVASLNEFRKHFGLQPHRTFESINSNPEVAEQLKRLYDHPDHVELYPGLVVEEPKVPMLPGAGLSPGFTLSRAVLSDAVALVRGDRFYTIDYHPKKLTNWGYTAADFDTKIDNGCVFYKLFLRAFPKHFETNSVYAHYPLTIPSEMKLILTYLGKADKYNFDKPARKHKTEVVCSYKACDAILEDQKTFKVSSGPALEFLLGPHSKNFMLANDGPPNAASRKLMSDAMYVDGWTETVKKYYEDITTKLLKRKSYKLAGKNTVDIIRDVSNLAHVHFASDMFFLPIKNEAHPSGIFTEHELYLIMTTVFTSVFYDFDPVKTFPLRQQARTATKQLAEIVEMNVKAIGATGFLHGIMQHLFPNPTTLSGYGIEMIKRLLKSGMGSEELTWGHIMATAGGMVAKQGHSFSRTLEYFLTKGSEHLPEINRLAKQDDQKSFDTLMKYFLEGSRLSTESAVFRTATRDVTLDDNGRQVKVAAGDQILVNLKSASMDPAIFPEPEKLKLDRPLDAYIHLGAGPHKCLGLPMTRVALTSMLKTIGKLDGLQPVRGPQGKVHKVLHKYGPDVPENRGFHSYLSENHTLYMPFPCSLKVNWKGELP